jgi:hypothetical protein
MTTPELRIPAIDPDTVPEDRAASPLLAHIRAVSGGRLLNMHLQMAQSPAVLTQYTALRQAMTHTRIDERARATAAVAVSAIEQNEYTLAVNAMLARRVGWTEEQVSAITDGRSGGDTKIDALLAATREAVRDDGSVPGSKWLAALDAGWTLEDLTDIYAVIALVVFCDRFVRYAGTETDAALTTAASRRD